MSRISRRNLLTSGAAAGVLAASGMAMQAAPKTGGMLRAVVAGGTPQDDWDSRKSQGFFMIVAGHGMIFDCLTEVGADGALRGELAESWEASVDARVWTVNLRKGVTFHNGKPFGAEDVIESMALHMGPDTTSRAAPLLSAVTTVNKITEQQVQFHLSAPNADFPYLLADHHLVIYPAGYTELAMQNGIGTGLYRVEKFEPGRILRASRVASHYKGNAAGFFADVEVVNEASGSALSGGSHHLRPDVLASSPARRVQDGAVSDRFRIHRIAGNRHIRIDVGSAGPGHWDLQRALKHAIDRRALLDQAFGGKGVVGNDTPIGPANQYFAHDLEPVPFDPDIARHHLRKSGVKALTIDTASCGTADECLLEGAIRRHLGEIGLNVHSGDKARGAFAESRFYAGRATEDWSLSAHLAQAPEWANARFQNLLMAARSEMDGNRRRAHYRDLQEFLRDHGSSTVPAFTNHVFATSMDIGTPAQMGHHWALDNARMAERWWRV